MAFNAAPLRALVSALSFELHGVAIVVEPAPFEDEIATRGIWLTPQTPDVPGGAVLSRRDSRRVMALSRTEVPTVKHGMRIRAPEPIGGDTKFWVIDGIETLDPDHVRVVVVPDTTQWP